MRQSFWSVAGALNVEESTKDNNNVVNLSFCCYSNNCVVDVDEDDAVLKIKHAFIHLGLHKSSTE
jgi:hypothetical protein